jgi:hypothetical protein
LFRQVNLLFATKNSYGQKNLISEKSDSSFSISLKISSMKQFIVLVFLLLLAAATYIAFTYKPRQFSLKDVEPMEGPEIKTEEPAAAKPEIAEATLMVADTKKIEPKETVVQTKRATESVTASQSETNPAAFYIIIEGFKNLKAAQDRAANLEKKFNSRIYVLEPTHAGIYRISYGKYSTKEQADSALIYVRIKIRPEAWILPPKK